MRDYFVIAKFESHNLIGKNKNKTFSVEHIFYNQPEPYLNLYIGTPENDFQCKTLEKRRYLDFPSDVFHDGKSLVAVTSFHGAGACLTWKHL